MSDLKSEHQYKKETKETEDRFEAEIQKQATTGLDKTRSADVAGRLHQVGTSESAQRVREAMEATGEAVDKKMQQQREEFGKLVQEAREGEEDLRSRAAASKQDADALGKLERHLGTKDAQKETDQAMYAARDGQRFLADEEKERKGKRKGFEKHSKDIANKTKHIKVKTK